MSQFFKLESAGDVSVVTFERQDKDMNILSEAVLKELDTIVDKIIADSAIKGMVFISGKSDQFIVGADITDIQKLTTMDLAKNGAKAMQAVFQKIHRSGKTSVAAIHGPTLGGGLELSLACSWRVATNDEKTKMGLPEIQLGFIPGAGGTQRLPRLIGLQSALDMILTAKRVDGTKALKMGLVDACVPVHMLKDEAINFAKKSPSSREALPKNAATWALEGNIVGRKVMASQARSMVDKKTKGFYPASYKALDAVFQGFEMSLEKGLDLEATLFGELVQTNESKSLIHLFHATTAIKKHPYKDAGKERFGEEQVQRVGIVGGGFMGGGIATVCADKGVKAFVSDPSKESLGRLLKSSKDFFYKKVKRKRLKPFQSDSKMAQINPQLTPAGFESLDIVVEAVFEDLNLKQKILAGLEAKSHKDWVFASNTSALPIKDIAAKSASPEKVLGMHFFSPVEKMPLLEIVVTEKTAPWATARAIDLGNQMGKTIIVVKDSPGFYTTRVLAFYLAESAIILGSGTSIEYIDKVLMDFGWPVGPITLIDEVGIDVGMHVMDTMAKAWPERFSTPPQFIPIKESGRLGRKNSKGFYKYEEGKKAGVDEGIYQLLKLSPSTAISKQEIIDRCVLGYINESARCLEENILPSAFDGDVGSVFGLGFPPFRGGPFKYVDTIGAKKVVDTLKDLESKHGKRFKPCDLLISMADSGKKFFPEES
ncbi:MAG: 3-hydroxyacyl-CoA dehydrogenase NAD-binding domain-containing protein [Proteobacteria bacterium]|nr:3-hydroxyacyl-CoA dehydrogenase NAD-binding domain-containing protein [Pseudomonadota bacterium]